MNETLYFVDGRTALRTERRVAHPPSKVWRAITDPAHLGAWFPFDVEVDLRSGGAIRFVPKDVDQGPTTSGVVTALDPPRVFAFTWGDADDVRFELSPDGERGCLLVLTHTFADHYGAASFTAGWETCLDAMESVLEGRAPEPTRDMAERHDHYVAAFGLDEGTTEQLEGEWRVRFERQMTRPAETLWSTLGGSGATTVGDPVPAGFTVAGIEAGAITAVDDAKLLEYLWREHGRDAGRVRVELGAGTGQGARLVVTQTGPVDEGAARDRALEAWRTRLDQVATELRALPS
ncbi:MAG TPA: SRPBCC family protein [Acidimicrobiia bacterium]